jgi:hypothetical protein
VPTAPAPLLSRVELPPDWRVLVVLDERQQGLSGAGEREALATLPPLPRERGRRDLPRGADARDARRGELGEFAAFAAGLNRVQRLLGQHFAPAQARQRADQRGRRPPDAHWWGTDKVPPPSARAPGGRPASPSCPRRRREGLIAAARTAGASTRLCRPAPRRRRARRQGAAVHPPQHLPARCRGPPEFRSDANFTSKAPELAMERPYILHMFTPGKQMSPFDVNMAADAGYQILTPYCEAGLDASPA